MAQCSIQMALCESSMVFSCQQKKKTKTAVTNLEIAAPLSYSGTSSRVEWGCLQGKEIRESSC